MIQVKYIIWEKLNGTNKSKNTDIHLPKPTINLIKTKSGKLGAAAVTKPKNDIMKAATRYIVLLNNREHT